MARKGNPISVRLGLNRSSSSSWFSESDRGSIRIFLSLYLTRLFCTAILLISMYLLISFLGSGDSFHLLLEKVGFSLGGRALSGTLRLLGCSAGLAFTVGFALRCLLTGEDWGAHMMLPSGEGTSSSANYNESFFIDVLLEGRPTGTETESVETGTSVNQAESGRLPPANQVAPRGDEAGPSNQPVSLQYHPDEVIGGDSIRSIERRLLSNKTFPSAHDIYMARINAEDLFEAKVEIIKLMAGLDPTGDWLGRGARALENPRTATGEESLERLSAFLDDLNQGGKGSGTFVKLKGRVFLKEHMDSPQNSAA